MELRETERDGGISCYAHIDNITRTVKNHVHAVRNEELVK